MIRWPPLFTESEPQRNTSSKPGLAGGHLCSRQPSKSAQLSTRRSADPRAREGCRVPLEIDRLIKPNDAGSYDVHRISWSILTVESADLCLNRRRSLLSLRQMGRQSCGKLNVVLLSAVHFECKITGCFSISSSPRFRLFQVHEGSNLAEVPFKFRPDRDRSQCRKRAVFPISDEGAITPNAWFSPQRLINKRRNCGW